MPRIISVRGIEILDDESVPDGEIWLNCPMQNGGKVRYMFSLTDHRMTQPGEGESFFLALQGWLKDLQEQLAKADEPLVAEARVSLILEAMDDFLHGRDTRTINHDQKRTAGHPDSLG
ncbi:MAG: hypothetical protein ACYTCN_10845 [Planctomycetota bacterium]|jgi:hypothetical protein